MKKIVFPQIQIESQSESPYLGNSSEIGRSTMPGLGARGVVP
jgi:hypothetical protein